MLTTKKFALAAIFSIAIPALAAPWSYSGKTGPQYWGKIHPAFKLCETGKEQSPVSLSRNATSNYSGLTFSYGPATIERESRDRGLKFDVESDHYVTIPDGTFKLLQFHFHTKSEHTLDGMHTPVELHFVHKNRKGQLLVVAVFIKNGQAHDLIAQLIQSRDTIYQIDLNKFLPARQTYFFYMGSLTTPPCSEGVRWVVMKHSIQMSNEQIDEIEKIFPNSYRPLKHFNNRKFLLIGK